MATIPDKYADLFTKRAFASLATILPSGKPQVTPVWIDYDGRHILVNSALGRKKDENIRQNPNVAVAIMDPENPYRYMEVRGRVAEITQNGAEQHIDKMALKYLGKEKYPFRQPGEQRVLYKIEPEHISSMG